MNQERNHRKAQSQQKNFLRLPDSKLEPLVNKANTLPKYQPGSSPSIIYGIAQFLADVCVMANVESRLELSSRFSLAS